ncbi:hypothetical protein [Sphingosinicella soli]|uniref:Uncharacterized protein n=1 Tax=Sphingosinicella soli TaxID=333708 RepID=A0A7W7F6R9_9SPHN|nr:hypothetical protein [Sphingosinicella soli]MBB4632014.1 hypothetical protein [Sphingosinicella soli]
MPAGPVTVSLAGQSLVAKAMDTITTPTGTWPVSDLGPVSGGRAYKFGLSSRPTWWSVCIVRYAVPSDTSVGERNYALSVNGVEVGLSVLNGSMKCIDNGEPVAPSMERLRAAVTAKRVLPYSSAAFDGWSKSPTLATERTTENKIGYVPGRIYGRSGMNNAIAYAVTGAGGEYGSSRGFISGDDAVMIAAAIAGNSAVFNDAAQQNRIQTLYGLGLPNLAIWSENHNLLRDPQIPLSGDKPYVNEGTSSKADQLGDEGEWCAPTDYPWLSQIGATGGACYSHGRDEAHLFNHGYAYWLATGDPRAAILQQAIAAYALASIFQGSYADGSYRTRFGYQRTTMNVWSAMWKLQDVAENASSSNGNILWPKARAQKMVDDVFADWKSQLASMDAGTSAHQRSSSIFRGIDLNQDSAYSNFMIQAYGPEAAYLFASKGEPAMLKRIAENMVLRFGKIGGTRGVYGKGTGSGFQILEGAVLPYTDTNSFITWTNAGNTLPTDNFDGSAQHTVQRAYWSLKLAQDAVKRGWLAAVPGLDDAISKIETARAKTAPNKDLGVVGWKHAAVNF